MSVTNPIYWLQFCPVYMFFAWLNAAPMPEREKPEMMDAIITERYKVKFRKDTPERYWEEQAFMAFHRGECSVISQGCEVVG